MFKTFVNYFWDFSQVRDISRATIVVVDLDDLVIVVEAILSNPAFIVTRMKNRSVPPAPLLLLVVTLLLMCACVRTMARP